MKRKIFFTGSIFRFYVPEIKKYAFCKYYDFTHLEPTHGLLVRVFDHFVDHETEDLSGLNNANWLFGYRTVHRWPDLRKETSWTSMGILAAEDDLFIPDFKGVQAFPDIVADESTIGPWYPILNLSERGKNCDYKRVCHLERKILTPKLGMEMRTGMEYCRINGMNVEKFFDLDEYGTRNTYYQMINVPIYADIPKDIRGRVSPYDDAKYK